jgi:hypothetical protein
VLKNRIARIERETASLSCDPDQADRERKVMEVFAVVKLRYQRVKTAGLAGIKFRDLDVSEQNKFIDDNDKRVVAAMSESELVKFLNASTQEVFMRAMTPYVEMIGRQEKELQPNESKSLTTDSEVLEEEEELDW